MHRVVVITGGTSGIGAACACAFIAQGDTVYTLSRHGKTIQGAVSLCADVTDYPAVTRQLNAVIQREDHIDLLLCCAGFGISGALEFTESNEAHQQLEVNLFGIDNVVKAVLPQMRRQGSGKPIGCLRLGTGDLFAAAAPQQCTLVRRRDLHRVDQGDFLPGVDAAAEDLQGPQIFCRAPQDAGGLPGQLLQVRTGGQLDVFNLQHSQNPFLACKICFYLSTPRPPGQWRLGRVCSKFL